MAYCDACLEYLATPGRSTGCAFPNRTRFEEGSINCQTMEALKARAVNRGWAHKPDPGAPRETTRIAYIPIGGNQRVAIPERAQRGHWVVFRWHEDTSGDAIDATVFGGRAYDHTDITYRGEPLQLATAEWILDFFPAITPIGWQTQETRLLATLGDRANDC